MSGALRFDYMGAAEFEFGALPNSLRNLRAEQKNLRMYEVYLRGEQIPLYVYGALNEQELSDYVDLLNDLRNGTKQLKERSEFSREELIRWRQHEAEQRIRNQKMGRKYTPYETTNFWWDLTNDVLFTFDEDLADRIPVYLEGSWKVMDQNS